MHDAIVVTKPQLYQGCSLMQHALRPQLALITFLEYFLSIDFKRYYHMVERSEESKNFALIWVGQNDWTRRVFNTNEPIILRANTVVFGERDAPRVMEKLLKPLDELLSQEGRRSVRTMDDIVVMAPTIMDHVRSMALKKALRSN